MSIVLMGSTSGSCTLQEQAVAGTTTLTLPTTSGTLFVQGQNSAITSGTAVTPSGTAVDFTGIPSWAKRITVMFNGVSLSATDRLVMQLGDSGGIETTGYTGGGQGDPATPVANSTFFNLRGGDDGAAFLCYGTAVLTNFSGNTWVLSGVTFMNQYGAIIGGSKTLSDVLTQVRITRNGTATFDAGSINILYE